jgi:RNA polymerase subunit RPABC4/transcription elongation factor Spt4
LAKVNKFGELDDSVCQECGDPIKPGWVACPACGGSLLAEKKSKARRDAKKKKVAKPACGGSLLAEKKSKARRDAKKKKVAKPFDICPKCGQDTTADTWKGCPLPERWFCKKCKKYICPACLQDAMRKGGLIVPASLWCPVCRRKLAGNGPVHWIDAQ